MNVILQGIKTITAITVTTNPTLVNNNGHRKGLVIRNNSTVDIFLGKDNVSTSTGFPLLADEILIDEDSYDRKDGTVDYWFAVVASGTADLRIIEYA